MICGWSGWRWWSPATAACRWYRRAYPGNRPDVTQFSAVDGRAGRPLAAWPGTVAELTVVFDAGQRLGRQPGSPGRLRPALRRHPAASWHPDLLAIPASRYQPADQDRFGG